METLFYKALRYVVSFLEAHKIPFVIIGGLAVSVWGEPRATKDIDVKVFLGEKTSKHLKELVAQQFEDVKQPIPLIITARTPQGVPVDFLIAIPGYEQQILSRARFVDWQGLKLPFCSPEDLVIQKIVADRPRDWEDVESILIEQHGKLDQAYIRNWLAQFAEVLERPDWLTRYEELLAELEAAER